MIRAQRRPRIARDSQIYIKHCAVWILGIIFFFILIARLNGLNKQALLALTAGGSWLLIPLLSQSVAQHGWVYGINFVPTIVLGWIGALSNVLPGKRSKIFGPAMIGFVPLLLWAIQLRWFMALYLRWSTKYSKKSIPLNLAQEPLFLSWILMKSRSNSCVVDAKNHNGIQEYSRNTTEANLYVSNDRAWLQKSWLEK